MEIEAYTTPTTEGMSSTVTPKMEYYWLQSSYRGKINCSKIQKSNCAYFLLEYFMTIALRKNYSIKQIMENPSQRSLFFLTLCPLFTPKKG
jgi:hypothetical protein